MTASQDSTADIEERIERARTALLFSRGNLSRIAGLGFAVVLAVAASGQLDATWVWTWLAAKVIVALVRVEHCIVHRRRGEPTDPSWYRAFVALAVLDGAVWGLCGLWLIRIEQVDVATLLIASVVGVAAAGVFVMHASLAASLGFAVPVLLPPLLVALAPGGALGWHVSAGLGIYLMVLVSEAMRMRAQLDELIRLRYSHEVIAQERAAAQLEAQRLGQIQGQLQATMTEQMRSPLSGVIGMARMLANGVAGSVPADRRKVMLIERAALHVLRLIDELTDYSRFTAGELHLASAPFDLAAAIDGVGQLAAASASDKRLTFQLALTPLSRHLSYRVVGDEERLGQILHHLLGHALKSVARGEIELHAAHDADTGRLEVVVTSYGLAVADAVTQAVEEFAEAGDRPSRNLGLGLSRRLAEAMGGEVTVLRGNGCVLRMRLVVVLPTVHDARPSSPGELYDPVS